LGLLDSLLEKFHLNHLGDPIICIGDLEQCSQGDVLIRDEAYLSDVLVGHWTLSHLHVGVDLFPFLGVHPIIYHNLPVELIIKSNLIFHLLTVGPILL
jgi:hypothetical protein